VQKQLNEPEELCGVVPDVTSRSTHQVLLRWFRERSARTYQDWFCVVENDEFELILGQRKVAQNFRLFSHTVASRLRIKGRPSSTAAIIAYIDSPTSWKAKRPRSKGATAYSRRRRNQKTVVVDVDVKDANRRGLPGE
jgi:hypothetical protein